jgi:outer membrane protein assembly factor BamB
MQRRHVLAGLGALPFGALIREAPTTETNVAKMPFARGDVVVGCTLLNDPKDDHRGRGRILHYDADLRLKNTLWLDDTTHIVQGLKFAPDRTLWAFDSFAYKIARFSAEGGRLADFKAPARSFAHITFAEDGRFFLGENFVGEKSRVPLGTTLPFMPGTRRFGDGHLFEFSRAGKLLREHRTPVDGGMGGFQGLTSSAIAPDGRTLFYTSESGPRIMRWDLLAQKSLPDLTIATEKSGRMFFDLRFDEAGRLLVVNGRGVDALDDSGRLIRSYTFGSFGWAPLGTPRSGYVYLSNFFSGEVACLDLASGALTARAQTGIRKSASGIDSFPG